MLITDMKRDWNFGQSKLFNLRKKFCKRLKTILRSYVISSLSQSNIKDNVSDYRKDNHSTVTNTSS